MPIPRTMTAVEITSPGGPEVLRPVERPVPVPAAGEALIQVTAAGVNRPDIMQRLGKYPPPPGASDIPGLEISGTIVTPAGRWREGDEVCALVSGGGYAEYCAVPAQQCLPIPAGIPIIEAAAIPETFFTVWTNLFQRAGLKAGDHVLVHGGTSGIGTTAIQLARAFGATVHATAGSDEKRRACLRLGATTAIDYRNEDFVERTMAVTGNRGVDIVLDIVGGEYLARNISVLAMNGRLVQIGTMRGSRAEINLTPILQRRLTLTGSTLRPRTPDEKGAIARELEAQVWPLLAAGTVAPQVDLTLALADAPEAHRLLEAGEVIGKIVLFV